MPLRAHHVGVQTADLDNSVRWYTEFFGARVAWELDRFSDLTLSRLPGIRRLVEVSMEGLCVHLIDRAGHTGQLPPAEGYQFQHVCLQVSEPEQLEVLRDHWIELYESGRFSFARTDPPTDIVVDADGVSSVYLFDPNGLEYELTHVPDGPR
uniref:SibV n=1 Tax=Streptosporangium sibiricum TaxID=457432 RepID=C0LTN6_STRSJ|nr:SibV [Streptosporangium sibiricum]